MKSKSKFIGIVGQLLAVVMVSVGLGYEIAVEAHFGFILITAGSLIFGVGTKVRYQYKKD